ncbi:amidophosphoribosyltransferase [Gemmatimonas phototrophica]|uniref:Amidophosphoribosyltransferase n=1 Tax=Gemmatimonas phototrophica TaxID=1379270 RepID=A0A143BK75_9BACT|nr:amidophosphoribosyltransferase [Gemmatimonas phototrophica]AMW04985.1 amidophosphoribosyltransferase [Gemmatimonas phototrophica]
MCGIFGVYGHKDAAALTQLGLYSLQHRGQESAGIVAVDDIGHARVSRAMGLVSEGFADDEMAVLQGPIAIGHTRYSTAGSSAIENAQPVLARVRRSHIALAHNGNLTNAVELRRALEDDGAIFSSTMDSEVIVHRIARATGDTPEAKVAEALQGVEGAYCLLVVLDETVIVARDPHGWRPLVMGRLADSIVFASETCALDIVGAVVEREIQPGEIVAVDSHGIRSLRALESAPLNRCVFEHVYFARPDSKVFGGSVDRSRRALGRQLARECPAIGAEVVFAVPDSSNSAALGFAEESGIPYELALIRNHYVGRTFIQPTQSGRNAKVKVKYNPVREIIEGKKVVMVDDSIVRGTTTRGLVSLVRAAGAKEVHMRVSSAPIISPCYYGIDTPRREELIAAQMTHEELVRHLGVDSLGYLSIDGMLSAMPEGPSGYCHACFSGRYPTATPADPELLRAGSAAGVPVGVA